MATVTALGGSFHNGACKVEYTYDSVTLLVTSVIVVNNGPAGTLTATCTNPTTGAVLFGGPLVALAGTGTTSHNVKGLGLLMVATVFKGTTYYGLPFGVSLSWSS